MIIVLEGVDGVGKTTIARKLADSLPLSTLLKLSGSPKKVDDTSFMQSTYNSLIPFLIELGNKAEIVMDRSWVSELVYSPVFKSYDPESYLKEIINNLHEEVEVHYILLTLKEEELEKRIESKKEVQPNEVHIKMENAKKIMRGYDKWFKDYSPKHPHNYWILPVDGLSVDEAVKGIIKFIGLEGLYSDAYC